MKLVEAKSRSEWREWLAAHHNSEPEAWLVYFRAGSGKEGVDYESSVEEALCFGWVDSVIKKIDEASYARKFTPRKPESKWSPTNIARVEKMIREGLMTERGLALVESAKRSGAWDNPTSKPVFDLTMPSEFEAALRANPTARQNYENLSRSHREQYLLWIVTAKRPETLEKRIAESIQMLSEGKKLGLR
jgi:uncharacterized protein YdeI (YjbR/CyaY-like superfamily)